tara:strand:+ start:4310 stop:4612 length:303 start_codon:yes stop_codon:yes gene_type:complete
MTLPKISPEALIAQIDKATQKSRDEFAADIMLELTSEQPAMMAAIVGMLEPLLSKPEGIEEVPIEVAQEIILESTFSAIGLVLKTLNAQIEAEEMNQHWG